MMRNRCAGPCCLALLLVACSDDPSKPTPQTDGPHDPVSFPLTAEAYSALQALWEPLPVSADTQARIEQEQLLVTDIAEFDAAGLGVRLAAGTPWVEHVELAPAFSEGTARSSLLYIWQAADPQLIDEESPIRLEGFDGLYRPQGHLTVQVFESHVRTAQRISDLSGRPFDFALIAGDMTDGSQANELDWMLTAINGGAIDPDSGVDDDPVPGPGNDYNDPLLSEGLAAPWYAVLGNHETLYNGGFAQIDDALREAAAGSAIYAFPLFTNGFRDGATEYADVVTEGETPPDPARVPQRRGEVLAALHDAAGAPTGHGLGAEDVAAGRGYFSLHPIEGKPIRLVALDTVNSTPTSIGVGSLGQLDEAQFDWLKQELDDADIAAELVIVMSHHRIADFSDFSPITGAEVGAVLEASDGVVLHITGHGHRNEKTLHQSMTGGYWELMLASTVDYPMQSRVIEVVDEANGSLSIYCTNLGHNAPTDSLAHRARELAAAKRSFPAITGDNDVAQFWADDVPAQNLLLRIAIPEAMSDNLAKHSWPSRIESLETLMTLSGP